jgi:hypothetical protein
MRAHDALAVLVQGALINLLPRAVTSSPQTHLFAPDFRVDAMSVDSSGKTAWDLARDNGDDIALQLLQARGCLK